MQKCGAEWRARWTVACAARRGNPLALDVHQSAVYRGLIQDQTLWTCGRDKDVKAWSLDSLEALDKLKLPHTRSVNAMALGGPDGAHLATGSDDRSIKVWAL